MKLKLVVAFMSVAGLISCPAVLAATQTQTQKHSQQKVHTTDNYKGDEVGLKGEGLAPVVACPKVDMYTPILDAMSQNTGRAKATVDCNKPIQLAGGINFDTQWGNLSEGYMGENNTRLSLNDAYLNATGHINDWVQAFLEISYSNVENDTLNGSLPSTAPHTFSVDPYPGLYSQAYTTESLTLQQGYITIGDPSSFPLFLKLGKQFQDFGRYTIHPLNRSMTQVMTETLQTSAELSFISGWNTVAFHGSAFVFENPLGQTNSADPLDTGHLEPNYGAQIGLGQANDHLGWDLGVGYLYNMTGVNDIAYAVTLFHNGSGVTQAEGGYRDRVSALTAYGMVNSGPFNLSAHYVTALQSFNAADLTFGTNNGSAEPWSWDLTAGYGFNYWERAQNLYVGYEKSGEASSLYLPESRWVAGYGVDVWKNTNVGVEYSYDDGYSLSDGGNGENSNRVGLRVGVKFG